MGWSRGQTSVALTLSLIVSALSAPVMGRVIDKNRFTILQISASLVGVVLLVLMAYTQYLWQFYLYWAMMGVVMSAVLYEPCFAILTRVFEHDAKKAITGVTLVAGFASTYCFPVAHYFETSFGWRNALLIFAAIQVFVATPLIFIATRLCERLVKLPPVYRHPDQSTWRDISVNPLFWLLFWTYFAFALNHSMIITHIIPMVSELDISQTTAILAASLIGPMQVVGRMIMQIFHNRVSPIVIAGFALVSMILASFMAMAAHWVAALVFLFVFFQGSGNGVSSVIRPMLTAQLLGRTKFGEISGYLAFPFIAAFAIGPFLSAAIWGSWGYLGVQIFAIGAAIIGIFLLNRVRLLVFRQDQTAEG